MYQDSVLWTCLENPFTHMKYKISVGFQKAPAVDFLRVKGTKSRLLTHPRPPLPEIGVGQFCESDQIRIFPLFITGI